MTDYICYSDYFLRAATRLKPAMDPFGDWNGGTDDPDVTCGIGVQDGLYEWSIDIPTKVKNGCGLFLIFPNLKADTIPESGFYADPTKPAHGNGLFCLCEANKETLEKKAILLLLSYEIEGTVKKYYLVFNDFVPFENDDRDKYSGQLDWQWSL